jgi:hypothetical protein
LNPELRDFENLGVLCKKPSQYQNIHRRDARGGRAGGGAAAEDLLSVNWREKGYNFFREK